MPATSPAALSCEARNGARRLRRSVHVPRQVQPADRRVDHHLSQPSREPGFGISEFLLKGTFDDFPEPPFQERAVFLTKQRDLFCAWPWTSPKAVQPVIPLQRRNDFVRFHHPCRV